MSMPRLQKRGFTLVETLVAITVLLLVVIGPITVAQRGIKSAYYANEQVTAVFLAQEAIEAIRELRDSQALDVYAGDSADTWAWHNAIEGTCTVSVDSFPRTPGENNGGCAFNVESGDFQACDDYSNNNCQLVVSATQEYNYGVAGNDSGFTRRVYVGDTLTGGGVPVMVKVTWQSSIFSNSPTREVVLETWVYDHYERYETF